jgi:uncharacterized protein YkwD
MVRQYGPVVAIVVLLLGGVDWLLTAILPPERIDLESTSAEVGWTDAMSSDFLARDIYVRVNDERAARGLAPLVWDEDLAELARRWSETMIATSYEHSSPEFRAHPAYSGSGENIYMGPRSADEGHVGWMRSDGHRDNILHPGYTAIGIGVVCRNDGHMWATQIFGVPVGAQPAPRTSTPEEPIVRQDAGPVCASPRSWRR